MTDSQSITAPALQRTRPHTPIGRNRELRAQLRALLIKRGIASWPADIMASNAIEHAHRAGQDDNVLWMLRDIVKMRRFLKASAPAIPPETVEKFRNDPYIQSHQGVAMKPNPDSEKLDEIFPRTPDGQPVPDEQPTPAEPVYPDYCNDPDKAKHAIPKHIRKELGIDENAIGLHIRNIYAGPLPDFLRKFGARVAYDAAQTYIAKVRANGTVTVSEPKSDERASAPSSPKNGHSPDGGHGDSAPAETPKIERSSAPETGKENATDESAPEPKKLLEFTPSPILQEVKTLQGIPVGQIGHVLNRRHSEGAYKRIKAKNGDEYWTDLDQLAVRRRFDRVFGPQGFGWRIVPLPGIGQVKYAEETQTTRSGERRLHVVTFEAFVFEYALVMPDGKLSYVQTSALSDSDSNDDRGYAYRGAFTSLMKQALRTFGGFDHFMDKTA